jgi:ferredoxin-NADP reductase
MVRHLSAVGYDGEIGWLHYARREVMFADELAPLVKGFLGGRLSVFLTRGGGASASPVRFCTEQLSAFDPAWASCETFVCGPDALTRAVTQIWGARSLDERLHIERFADPPRPRLEGEASASHRLVFAKSARETEGRSGVSLLEQAESAGLSPRHGCRMGICHTCTCRKVSGTVRNELTGVSTSAEDEEIRLCVSTPLSDVTLDL